MTERHNRRNRQNLPRRHHANRQEGRERLGHSTVGLTLDTYSHVLPGVQEHAVEAFDAAIRAAMGDGSC